MHHPWPSGTIYFTGFMASGKSRVGEALARSLGWQFVDTDHYIEEKSGKGIPQIFAEEGEPAFRQMEIAAVEELSARQFHVISLGGGSLTQARIAQVVRETGILIRLNASVEVLSERISRKSNRPLMAGLDEEGRKAKIRSLLAEREKFYALADFAVESSEETPVDQLVRQIRNMVTAWAYRKVRVTTPGGDYPIFIGANFLDLTRHILQGLKADGDAVVVTDSQVAKAQAHNLRKLRNALAENRVFEFPVGEQNKNLRTLERLFSWLLRLGYTRKTLLLQFSGGVVGDMAGFGAATYQRGIPFVQIPTTLLAMVDSSVGGKVGVNHPLGKNMIGAFYQPRAVLVNLEVLHTLSPTEYLSGLAEVVKYGVIYDAEFFTWLEAHVKPLLDRDAASLEHVVLRSCQIKAEVVGQDEREEGIRAILNYGHTFGHAIEKLTDYEGFSHGIAVALGMRVAGRLATLLGMWSEADELRQKALLDAFGFPAHFHADRQAAWDAMGVDKKAAKGKRVFILPTRIGAVHKVSEPERDLVDQAWSALEQG